MCCSQGRVSFSEMAARILAGKVALVTGSTSGIGAAIARVLGRAGANLVVNGLVSKPEEGEAIRRGFENDLGVKVRFLSFTTTENQFSAADFLPYFPIMCEITSHKSQYWSPRRMSGPHAGCTQHA